MPDLPPVCASCGDPASVVPVKCLPDETRALARLAGLDAVILSHAGKPRCLDCYLELTQGKIPPAARVTGVPADGVTTPGRAATDDGPGPWYENALRNLEGD